MKFSRHYVCNAALFMVLCFPVVVAAQGTPAQTGKEPKGAEAPKASAKPSTEPETTPKAGGAEVPKVPAKPSMEARALSTEKAKTPASMSDASLSCRYTTDAPNPVLLCVEKPKVELETKDLITLIFSSVALSLSLLSLWITRKREQRLRRQSIEDDFWIRDVLGPLVVEPLIKDMFDTMNALPPDFATAGWNQAQLEEFGRTYQGKHQQMARAFRALELLDMGVCRQTLTHLDRIEDLIVEYCAANAGRRRTKDGQVMKSRAITEAALMEQMLSILAAIRTYQATRL